MLIDTNLTFSQQTCNFAVGGLAGLGALGVWTLKFLWIVGAIYFLKIIYSIMIRWLDNRKELRIKDMELSFEIDKIIKNHVETNNYRSKK